jgi:hypothetical protein
MEAYVCSLDMLSDNEGVESKVQLFWRWRKSSTGGKRQVAIKTRVNTQNILFKWGSSIVEP